MLSYFKYGGFALENFAALARVLGFDWHPAEPSIVLPIGISFYTFQTLSYTLDIHARRMKPCERFLDYRAVRHVLSPSWSPDPWCARAISCRSASPRSRSLRSASPGACRCSSWGCSRRSSSPTGSSPPPVETVFEGKASPTMLDSWVGCMGFAVQVFCDFSGYSLCAIGVAKCLGFDLPANFRFPFAATSMSAFWRRWHISVSSWVRDYVYAMVRGRSRGLGLRWAFNTVFSSLLIGLWHGAAWHWILWGLAIGVLIIIENVFRATFPHRPLWATKKMQFCFAFLTFAQFSMTMVPARSPDASRMGELVAAMFTGGAGGDGILSTTVLLVVSITGLTFFLGHWCFRHNTLEQLADRMPWPVKAVFLATLIGLVLMSRAPDRAFVYFQF